MPRNLVIFDVDETLIDAHTVDNDSFDHAFRKRAGIPLTAEMWTTFEEVTAKAIIRQALGHDRADWPAVEALVCELFLDGLRTHHREKPDCIKLTNGTASMLANLRINPEFDVAIATGCWRETALFKMGVAGIDITDVPFACASDRYARSEIISLAAELAGAPLERCVYVGDGIWDLRASRKLGIPFIGVGKRIEILREGGADAVLDDWTELPVALARVFAERPRPSSNG